MKKLLTKILFLTKLVAFIVYTTLAFLALPWWLAIVLTFILLGCMRTERKQKIDKSPEVLMYPVFD